MKKLLQALTLCSFFFAFTQTASALIFTDIVTFDPTEVVYGPFQDSGFSWVHDITDNIGGSNIGDITLVSATLTISHDNTGVGDPSELWEITDLGNLNSSNAPISTVFVFNASNLADLQADGSFEAFLTEHTEGNDRLHLFTATLSGNYNVNGGSTPGGGGIPHTPEPMTVALIAAGLAMAGLSRKFRKKS